jgi:hypothetical protein
MLKVSISKGNKKMGEIQSVSLPPIVTCVSGCACAKKCYAKRMCRYKNVKDSYDRNLEIYMNNPIEYWRQVNDAVCVSRFFRMHVAGDIPCYEYLLDMVTIASANPHCDILVFTKRYHFVNTFINNGGTIPTNLHLIFSEWEGMVMENQHNLPVAHVIFKGEQPKENWNICSGNCLECAKEKANCWSLQNGEHVAFYEH